NVKEFFTQDNLDGGLIGQASVDPQIFIQVIQNSIIQ
ncbi:MAG TPA: triose-phosphate isomerase, partial [Ignavibacteriales bacterium]|nr:triose-phosphate isomerase [Ignavibacteriales bacterium]